MDGVTGCPVLSFITSQDREEHSTLVSDSPWNPGWQQDPSKSSLGFPVDTVWSRFQRSCPSRGVKDVETPRAGPGVHRAPENFCSGQLCPSTRWGNRVPEQAAPGARTS